MFECLTLHGGVLFSTFPSRSQSRIKEEGWRLVPAGRKNSRDTYMIDNARKTSTSRKSPSSDRPRPRPNVSVCEGLPQQRRLRIKKRAKARKSTSSDRPRLRPNVPVCEGLPQQRRLRIKKRAKTQNLHVRFMTMNIGSMTGKSREIADIMHSRKIMIACAGDKMERQQSQRDRGMFHTLLQWHMQSQKWNRNHLEYRMAGQDPRD